MFDFTILVAPGAFASALAATLDLLSTAAALAARVGAATPRWRLVSADGGMIRLGNGMQVETRRLGLRHRADPSIWVVPGLATQSPKAIEARLQKPDAQQAVKALRVQARAGGEVAASCSGVFLLQAAGLLADRKVTTSWWLAPYLQQIEPRCRVDANRLVITDGPVWTAGAAFAQTDLMLHLLRARFGADLADAVARVLLIDGREAQAPFIVPALMATGDELIAQLSARIEESLPQVPSIVELAAGLCVSERTLVRRVQAATGQSPSSLVQSVRLKRARRLLESSRLSVEQIADQVGYRDATALRRLMRKRFGVTPRQWRGSGRPG